jgi:uncharacterized protein with FMN-binding domain
MNDFVVTKGNLSVAWCCTTYKIVFIITICIYISVMKYTSASINNDKVGMVQQTWDYR